MLPCPKLPKTRLIVSLELLFRPSLKYIFYIGSGKNVSNSYYGVFCSIRLAELSLSLNQAFSRMQGHMYIFFMGCEKTGCTLLPDSLHRM